MSTSLYTKIQEACEFVQRQTPFKPSIGIVLGTGLGGLVEDIDVEKEIDFEAIPHMPKSTVVGHAGKIVFGSLSGQAVVALAGRFHYYEGYDMQEVTFGIRLLKMLGIEHLLLSNVAGGLQADMEAGEIVLVSDHINLHPANPLRGKNDARLGPRFPDMLHAYDSAVNDRALALAKTLNIKARKGVYVALAGPNLETPAEYKFLHIIGADVVGMSTVPEVIVARHLGLSVNVFSMVSNVCYPIETLTPTSVEEVIAVAEAATPKLVKLVKALLGSWL